VDSPDHGVDQDPAHGARAEDGVGYVFAFTNHPNDDFG
jgi:hypothetical protein